MIACATSDAQTRLTKRVRMIGDHLHAPASRTLVQPTHQVLACRYHGSGLPAASLTEHPRTCRVPGLLFPKIALLLSQSHIPTSKSGIPAGRYCYLFILPPCTMADDYCQCGSSSLSAFSFSHAVGREFPPCPISQEHR
jgi:hypothetical protein